MRKIFHKPLCEFIGQEGEYTKAMKKLFSHKQGVILSGQQMKSKPRAQYVRGEKGKAMLMMRDCMEKMSVSADNQMQFEYFNKHVSLGAEGITVCLKRPGEVAYETIFYAILSTEQKQDGRIVYRNAEMVLERITADMEKAKAAGAEVVNLEAILDNSDGCAVQYRCGTALFML